jgi:hypothetical protein
LGTNAPREAFAERPYTHFNEILVSEQFFEADRRNLGGSMDRVTVVRGDTYLDPGGEAKPSLCALYRF